MRFQLELFRPMGEVVPTQIVRQRIVGQSRKIGVGWEIFCWGIDEVEFLGLRRSLSKLNAPERLPGSDLTRTPKHIRAAC